MEIHVDLPERFVFEVRRLVEADDVNYGGHLANEAFLKIASQARVRFLEKHGLSELDVGGVGIIMTGAVIEYLAEGREGDEIVTSIAVEQTRRSSFAIFYRIARADDGVILAKVRTDLACFDYQARKVRRIPDRFMGVISG